jgi:hypothetical protein
MSQKIQAVNSDPNLKVTQGKDYEVLDRDKVQDKVKIIADDGSVVWVSLSLFLG